MSCPVKCIGQVKFYHHPLFFDLVARMNGFLDQHNVILNLAAFDETSLVFQDYSGQQFFESICNYFGYNFVAQVAKRDGPESGEMDGPFFFWDQS